MQDAASESEEEDEEGEEEDNNANGHRSRPDSQGNGAFRADAFSPDLLQPAGTAPMLQPAGASASQQDQQDRQADQLGPLDGSPEGQSREQRRLAKKRWLRQRNQPPSVDHAITSMANIINDGCRQLGESLRANAVAFREDEAERSQRLEGRLQRIEEALERQEVILRQILDSLLAFQKRDVPRPSVSTSSAANQQQQQQQQQQQPA
jgi:hypothetical protein